MTDEEIHALKEEASWEVLALCEIALHGYAQGHPAIALSQEKGWKLTPMNDGEWQEPRLPSPNDSPWEMFLIPTQDQYEEALGLLEDMKDTPP